MPSKCFCTELKVLAEKINEPFIWEQKLTSLTFPNLTKATFTQKWLIHVQVENLTVCWIFSMKYGNILKHQFIQSGKSLLRPETQLKDEWRQNQSIFSYFQKYLSKSIIRLLSLKFRRKVRSVGTSWSKQKFPRLYLQFKTWWLQNQRGWFWKRRHWSIQCQGLLIILGELFKLSLFEWRPVPVIWKWFIQMHVWRRIWVSIFLLWRFGWKKI